MMQAAKGKGYILAGGTDLLVQMKSGARTPGVIVDVKKIPEMVSVTEKNGAFTIGAADAGRRARRAQEAAQGLAGRGRGLQPDRLDPGPGPRLAPAAICATPRRPPTACRRWSPRAASSTWPAPTASATVPVEKFCIGPGKTSLKTGEIVVSLTLPARPKGSSRRLSAPDPAHRDGHRRRRRRRQRSP